MTQVKLVKRAASKEFLARLLVAVGCVFLFGAVGRAVQLATDWWNMRPLYSLPELATSSGALLVIFQEEDCSSYDAFIRRWSSLHESGEFTVIGVPIGDEDDSGDFGLQYPVRADLEQKAIRVLAGFGHPVRTPSAVLIDQNGVPRMSLEPTADPRSIRTAHELVRTYGQYLRNGGDN